MAIKKLIQAGDQVTVYGELRTVTELKKNTAGGIVIIWSSDHTNRQVGGCTPSLWAEWGSSADLKRRRF